MLRVTHPLSCSRLRIKIGDQSLLQCFELDDRRGVGCRSPALEDLRN
jgi:hypothetical protein